MSRVAFVNGRYVPLREASVNVEDRGYQFADGVYEVIHLYRGRFIDADLHFARLERSLAALRIAMPMARAALECMLHELVRRNRIAEGIIYMQVTRGVARREHGFPARPPRPALVATLRRIPPFPARPDSWTATAITLPDQRWARCDIKSTGLLPNVLARQAARERGATEAILVGADGLVTEAAAANVWIVDAAGVLRTRALGPAILPGCTRAALLAGMAEERLPVEERAFTVDELRAAQECFLTSASSFVKAVLAVDDQKIGTGEVGPVTARLFRLFARHVQGGLPNAA